VRLSYRSAAGPRKNGIEAGTTVHHEAATRPLPWISHCWPKIGCFFRALDAHRDAVIR
jgi:hypothetical protein